MLDNRILSAAPSVLFITLSLPLFGCGSDDNSGTDGSGGTSSGASGGAGGSAATADSGGGAAGSPAAGSTDWTRLGYDLASTYHNTAETRLTKDNVANLAPSFTIEVGAAPTGAPLMVGDTIYALGGSGGRLVAYDLGSGTQIWEAAAGASASLAFDDGTLYLHDGGGILRAFDASNGVQRWEVDTNDHPFTLGFSSPIIVGNQVLVGGASGEITEAAEGFRGFVLSVDKETGGQLWKTYTVNEEQSGASVWSTVSVEMETNTVYVTTGNNFNYPASDTSDAILTLGLADGAMQWKNQRLADDVFTSYRTNGNPDFDFGANAVLFDVGDQKLLAAGQKSGDIHVLSRTDGGLICQRNLGPGNAAGSQGILNNGAWDGTRLLFASSGADSGSAVLFGIDPLTCDILWDRPLPGPWVMGPITVANGVGFVPADTTLVAFDTETGEDLFTYPTDGTIASATTISNGRIAFGSGMSWIFGTTGTTVHVLEVP